MANEMAVPLVKLVVGAHASLAGASLDTPTLAFDGILIALGLLSVGVVWKILRRRVSGGLIIAALGLILLSLVHLSETLLGIFFNFVGQGTPELVHRVLILSGFLWLIYGLARIGVELRRERNRVLQANSELIVVQGDLRLSNEELRERNRQLLEAHGQRATAQPAIRVVIAGSDPNLRRLLSMMLAEESDIRMVGQAADKQEALAAAERLRPDIVLIDDALADQDFLGVLKSMTEPPQVIVLATYRHNALNTVTAGAFDYLLKDSGRERLIEAIRRAGPRRSALIEQIKD